MSTGKSIDIDLSGAETDFDKAVSAASGETELDSTVIDETGDEAKKAELPARAIRNDDGSVTLPFLRPVVLTIKTQAGVREETVASLTFREMTGLDLRMIAQAPVQMQTVMTMARATNTPPQRMTPLFDRMLARDVAAAAAVISFLQE